MSERLRLRVNGHVHDVEVEPDTPLLYVLRHDLGLKAARFGCGLEQCGACKVLIDGQASYACTFPVESAVGRDVLTLEGLGTPERPHALQSAFLEENAGQCGYCVSGLIIGAAALLRRLPRPTDEQVKEELSAHLCRCGSHPRYVRAVQRAAAQLACDEAEAGP